MSGTISDALIQTERSSFNIHVLEIKHTCSKQKRVLHDKNNFVYNKHNIYRIGTDTPRI